MSIDTRDWRYFYLKNICKITMGNKLDYRNMTFERPTVNFIGRSADNNGVSGIVDEIDGMTPYPGGLLTVALGGSLGATFLQNKPFYTSQNVSVLQFSDDVGIGAKLFVAQIIMNECQYKYVAFGRELNVHIRTDFGFYLPATPDGVPDWDYMDKFVSRYFHGFLQTSVQSKNIPLNIEKWDEFKLNDLFEIKKGKRLTSEEQTDGNTVYIGAIEGNNGVAAYIGQAAIHEGNTISLSYNGSVGEAFYQPEPFWATDDVNVLYFKESNHYEFNPFIGLFIATILRKEKYRFSYGRKWTLENMKNTIIRLPTTVDSQGKLIPDWKWMEDYIRSLPYSDKLEY